MSPLKSISYKLVEKQTRLIVAEGSRKEMHSARKNRGQDSYFVGLSSNIPKIGTFWPAPSLED